MAWLLYMPDGSNSYWSMLIWPNVSLLTNCSLTWATHSTVSSASVLICCSRYNALKIYFIHWKTLFWEKVLYLPDCYRAAWYKKRLRTSVLGNQSCMNLRNCIQSFACMRMGTSLWRRIIAHIIFSEVPDPPKRLKLCYILLI